MKRRLTSKQNKICVLLRACQHIYNSTEGGKRGPHLPLALHPPHTTMAPLSSLVVLNPNSAHSHRRRWSPSEPLSWPPTNVSCSGVRGPNNAHKPGECLPLVTGFSLQKKHKQHHREYRDTLQEAQGKIYMLVRATLPLQFLVLKSRSSRSRTIHARDNPHKG